MGGSASDQRDSFGCAGTLYVVATPIGNLDDLTLRARRALEDATVVVAEDTRRTRALLSHLGLEGKALVRIDANATDRDLASVVERLGGGEHVALCTDAGTPGVSDPGAALVTRARSAGISVVPLPGASAVTTALSASGYSFGAFRFVGFLPRTGTERARAIASLGEATEAVVFFESPQRLVATLVDLARAMPERRATIARELTKLHEEILEGPLPELVAKLETREILGELTIVLAPWEPVERTITLDEVDARIDAASKGMRPREVAERVALETGWSKRDVYERILARKNQ
jgi:16S rRNA (cytidine1402-2'-O)-methyltransferase